MKKKLIKLVPWLLLIIITTISIFLFTGESRLSKKSYLFGTDISSAENKITCVYPQTMVAFYSETGVDYEIPKAEKNPLIFTFSGFKDGTPELSYVDTFQSVSTTPIIMLVDNEEKLSFLAGDGSNYLTIHTIYKKQGISSYTKQVNLLGTLSTSMAFGSCNFSY